MKAETPRDRRLEDLGVKFLDKPRKVKASALKEGEVFALSAAPLAKAWICLDDTDMSDGVHSFSIEYNGRVQGTVRVRLKDKDHVMTVIGEMSD